MRNPISIMQYCFLTLLLFNVMCSFGNHWNKSSYSKSVELFMVSENLHLRQIDSLYRKMVNDHSLTEQNFKNAQTYIYALSDNAFFDDAERYLHLFIRLADKKGSDKDMALLYHTLGYNSKKKGDYDKALIYYDKSISLREKIKDRQATAPTLSNMGHIYYDMGAYSRAIEMYRKSLIIRLEMEDEKGMARTLSGIGNVLSDQKNFQEALQNYRQALAISSKIKDTMQIAASYTQMAGVKYILKELDSSLYYSQQSLKYANAVDYSYMAAYALANIGATYLEKGEFSKAEEYLKNSLVLREELQSPLEITLSLLELARLYRYKGKPDEALRLAKIAYETSDTIQFLKGKKLASEHLSDAYAMKEEYRMALDYFKEYKALNDSLFTLEEKKIIDDVQTQIKVEKETSELKLAQSRQSAFYTVLLVSLSIILFSAIIWFLYSRKLRDKQAEIAIRQKELESEQKILFSAQNERKRISQDMHDDLGTSLSGLRIYTEILMNKSDNEKYRKDHLKLLEMAKEVTLKVRDIVWTLDNKNDTIDNLIWYCHHYAENLFGNFPIQLNVKVEEDIPKLKISGNTRKQLFLSVKEALNNILKHSDADVAELSFSYADGIFTINIADDGKGFNIQQNTFSGNGISNMKSRMEAVDGNFKVVSGQNGSTILLTLSFPQKGY